METSQQIEIPLSKTKLILMLLGSIVFVVVGICFVTNPTKYLSFIIRSPTIIFIAGWASILFFGLCAYFLLKKLGDNKPGLIISERGITDNSSYVTAGFVPWSDITEIEETKVANQKFILWLS